MASFVREYTVDAVEAAGIPDEFKGLHMIPGATMADAPCTVLPTLPQGATAWKRPVYINSSDSMREDKDGEIPAKTDGSMPFDSRIEAQEIKSDFTVETTDLDRVGFYWTIDRDKEQSGELNYPPNHSVYMDRLCQIHAGAVIEGKAAKQFRDSSGYPSGHRLNGTSYPWNTFTSQVSDFNPFTEEHAGLFKAIDTAWDKGFCPTAIMFTKSCWKALRANTLAKKHILENIALTPDQIGGNVIIKKEWIQQILSDYNESPIKVFVGSGYFTASPIVKAKGSSAPNILWSGGEFYLYATPLGNLPGGIAGGRQYGWITGFAPLIQEPRERIGLSPLDAFPIRQIYGQQINKKLVIAGYGLVSA